MPNEPREGVKVIAQNRRARYDFHLGDTYEAGLVLRGTEVKSLRDGKASLAEAYVGIDNHGEAWLIGAHIPEYSHGNIANHDPKRDRKLLLHAYQLERLAHETAAKGVTLVPLRLYFRAGRAKLEFAVGSGKATHDKRRDIAKRDAQREIDRALRQRR